MNDAAFQTGDLENGAAIHAFPLGERSTKVTLPGSHKTTSRGNTPLGENATRSKQCLSHLLVLRKE